MHYDRAAYKKTNIEQNPSTRPMRLARSLQLCTSALSLSSSAAGYHHLAILYSRPGPANDLAAAEAAAARSVELGPDEVRSWHLLALILSARGEGKKARGVLEVAAALAEAGMDEGEMGTDARTVEDGVRARDYADGTPTSSSETGHALSDGAPHRTASSSSSADALEEEEEEQLLQTNAARVPHASTLLLRGVPAPPGPNRDDRLAYATQVKMTQLLLVEQIDGGENVGEAWRDVFGWYAARKGLGDGLSLRRSINGRCSLS